MRGTVPSPHPVWTPTGPTTRKALPQSRPASIPHSLARPSPRLLPLGAPHGGRPPRGEQRPAQRQSKSRGHFPQVWVQPHTRPPRLYERLVLTVGDCDRNHVGTTQEGWPGGPQPDLSHSAGTHGPAAAQNKACVPSFPCSSNWSKGRSGSGLWQLSRAFPQSRLFPLALLLPLLYLAAWNLPAAPASPTPP